MSAPVTALRVAKEQKPSEQFGLKKTSLSMGYIFLSEV